MKKIIILSAFLLIFVLSGCANRLSNDSVKKPNVEPAEESGIIFWRSIAQGDFVRDDRDPKNVCEKIQAEQGLSDCQIIISKKSRSKDECVDGMSVAGCFACEFSCR